MPKPLPPLPPDEPEQIGPLYFVPNADYPYPFRVEKPPRFWLDEQTGLLKDAVEVYLRTEPLNREQFELLILYLRQYVERAIITADADRPRLLSQLAKLRNVNEMTAYVEELAEWGLEPF